MSKNLTFIFVSKSEMILFLNVIGLLNVFLVQSRLEKLEFRLENSREVWVYAGA